MKAKKWILSKGFHGLPSKDNLKLIEFDLQDELKDGGIFQIKFKKKLFLSFLS